MKAISVQLWEKYWDIRKGLWVGYSKYLLIFLLLLSFILIFLAKPGIDEIVYHYPNVQNISLEQIINPHSNYSSAYTPLSYIISIIPYNIDNSIYSLRIFNYLIFLILIIIIYKIAELYRYDPILFILLLIANPYLLRDSFIYCPMPYGLMFAFAGIYFYLKNKHILSNLMWGLSVLCEQWMFVIIFAFFLNDFLFHKENLFRNTLYKFLFLIPSLILFYLWHGLTHPNFHKHILYPTLAHFDGIMANFGIVGLFLVLFNLKRFKKSYIPILFSLPIIWLTIPIDTGNHGLYFLTGAASKVSLLLSKYLFISFKVNMIIFIISGIFLLVWMLSKKDNYLKFILMGFIVAFFASGRLGASHIFVSVPFLLFFFYENIIKSKLLTNLITIQLFMISVIYMIYYSITCAI